MTDDLRAWLDLCGRGVRVLDAAIGTRLIARGLDIRSDDPALWVLDRPADVIDIHRRDREAGAEAIATDTFGANRRWLARYGREGDVVAINERAVALAREAGGDLPVIGSIGPTAPADLDAMAEQAGSLVRAGADLIVIETCTAGLALAALPRLASIAPGLPRVASLFDWPDDVEGRALLARCLIDAGATAVGFNCNDPSRSVGLAAALRVASRRPILARPAGATPDRPGPAPADWAAGLEGMEDGMAGGCCGTTEAHIAALRAVRDAGRSTRGDRPV